MGATVNETGEITAVTPAVEIVAKKNQLEKAGDFLVNYTNNEIKFSQGEEKAVVRRIDRRVLVLILWAYFFQQLDKSSLSGSYVSIFGIVDDANLVGRQYSWLGSILYIAQLVMQPLAAYILVKLPTGKVIATAIFLWGSSLAIMTSCKDFPSLLGLRFCLGAFEAMIAPSCVAVTQMWWRRSEQTLRTSYWNAMNGVTFIVGSLFTYGLGHIQSGVMYRYQIIFLFCGSLTVAYAVVVLVLMPDSPVDAKFLTHREKAIAVDRLRANQMGISSHQWQWAHAKETMIDLKTWCWFIMIISISIASGGISTFGNLIVTSFGYDEFQTILFNIPFGAIQIVAIITSGWAATRTNQKGKVITCVAVFPAVGTILMLTVPRKYKGVLLFGYYLVSCLAAITPMIYAWQAQNTGGETKKKCTSAVVFIGMCAGNIIGPLLYSTDDAPLYRPGLIANLVMFLLVGIISCFIPTYLAALNRGHEKRREELGKPRELLDLSMVRKRNTRSNDNKSFEENRTVEKNAVSHDNGMLNQTDRQNEDFIYVF